MEDICHHQKAVISFLTRSDLPFHHNYKLGYSNRFWTNYTKSKTNQLRCKTVTNVINIPICGWIVIFFFSSFENICSESVQEKKWKRTLRLQMSRFTKMSTHWMYQRNWNLFLALSSFWKRPFNSFASTKLLVSVENLLKTGQWKRVGSEGSKMRTKESFHNGDGHGRISYLLEKTRTSGRYEIGHICIVRAGICINNEMEVIPCRVVQKLDGQNKCFCGRCFRLQLIYWLCLLLGFD